MKRYLFILTLLPWSVGATPLTLQSAYEQVLEHAPSVAAQTAQWRARQAETRVQKGALLPQVSLSAGLGKLDTTRSTLSSSTPSIQYENDSKYWNLSVQQALYRADLWHQWKQYNHLAESEQARIASSKRQLFQQISGLYLQAVAAHQRLKLHQQMLQLHQQELKALNRRLTFGQAARDDIAQIESQIAQDQADLAQLKSQQNASLTQLALYLGHAVEISQLQSPLPRLAPLAARYLKTPLPDLETMLSQHHPDLQALKAEIRAAEEAIQVQQAGHKPRVDLVLSRRMSSNDSENTLGTEYQTTSLSVQLSVPLYSGGSTSASVESAYQRLAAAKANLQARTLELKQQLIQLHSQLQALYQQYQYNQTQVDSAKQVLTAVEKQFQAGQADQMDVIKARYLLNQAKSTQVNSAYQALNAALQLHNLITGAP